MSALSTKADIPSFCTNVCYVPEADPEDATNWPLGQPFRVAGSAVAALNWALSLQT